ncbi:MAG: hypothetical protein JWL58_1919, partial [Streptosporangiaceae bacterium]|nr:hypothetical protein [Streptosporangiaceae bacterium]
LVATIKTAGRQGASQQQIWIWGGAAIVVLLALSFAWDAVAGNKKGQEIEADLPAAEGPDAAGGFPVPPLDAPHYHGVVAGAPDTTHKEVRSGLH